MKTVPLSRGLFALIDDEDFDRVSKYKWYASPHRGGFVAMRGINDNGRTTTEYLHRFILCPPNNLQVDHIDGDQLNNTRSNLRTCTNAQNNANTRKRKNNSSGYKGVTWNRSASKWQAAIKFKRKSNHIGFFELSIDAAKAYDAAAREMFGEFGRFNFPRRGERQA